MLTRAGRNTLLATMALYGAAVALGYTELAVPAIAGGLGLGIALITVACRARLQVTMNVAPSRVSRGQRVVADISVRNESGTRSPGLWLSVPHGAHCSQIAIRSLAKHQDCAISLTLDCDRRGLMDIGPITIQRGDIFGLCHRTQVVGNPVTVCVHPVVHPLPLPPSTRLRQTDGAASLRGTGSGTAFHSLQEYVPGDDLRHVHWLKSASTTGDLLVRRHVEAVDAFSAVLLDTCASGYGHCFGAAEPFEMAIDLAASILVASAHSGHRIRLHTTGGVNVTADRGPDGARRVLDVLARVQPGDGELMSALSVVTGGGEASRHTGIMTLITGPEAEVPGEALRRLSRCHGRVIAAQVGGHAALRPERGNLATPGVGGRLYVFRAATAAEAAARWAAIVRPGLCRKW